MQSKRIEVSVSNKIAEQTNRTVYVCGNSDYVAAFTFDADWDDYPTKTARFIANGEHIDVVFIGNECAVPVMTNTYTVYVGVYAGDIKTSTPAIVMAKKSVLCDGGVPASPEPDVYAQIMELLNKGGVSAEAVQDAVNEYMKNNHVQFNESDPTVPDWAKQEDKPTYTADEVGALPANTVIPEPYSLPTASETIKGGMKVGEGLQMDGICWV